MKMAVIIVVAIVLVAGGILGYILFRDEIVQWRLDREWGRQADQAFAEENYQRLSELFEKVEDTLEQIVTYLKENDLLYTATDVGIIFVPEDELGEFLMSGYAQNRLFVCNEEILVDKSEPYLVELFAGSFEFSNILNEISRDNIIGSIFIEERSYTDVEISFGIRAAHTQLVQGNHGAMNYFIYYEGNEDMERFGNKRIREGWYIYITPPPG